MRGFEPLIHQYFGFLCDDYGFARVPNDSPCFTMAVFRRADTEIVVGADRGEFTVEIIKGGPPTIRETDTYFKFDLSSFAADRDGDAHAYRYRFYDSNAELTAHLEEEMATSADALRMYCMEVLEGRFDWRGFQLRFKDRWNRTYPPPAPH